MRAMRSWRATGALAALAAAALVACGAFASADDEDEPPSAADGSVDGGVAAAEQDAAVCDDDRFGRVGRGREDCTLDGGDCFAFDDAKDPLGGWSTNQYDGGTISSACNLIRMEGTDAILEREFAHAAGAPFSVWLRFRPAKPPSGDLFMFLTAATAFANVGLALSFNEGGDLILNVTHKPDGKGTPLVLAKAGQIPEEVEFRLSLETSMATVKLTASVFRGNAATLSWPDMPVDASAEPLKLVVGLGLAKAKTSVLFDTVQVVH